MLSMSPEAGHPPYEATITAEGRDGGSYLWTVGDSTYTTEENGITVTIDAWPLLIECVWTDGNQTARATIGAGLKNEAPVAYHLYTVPDEYLHGQRVLIDLRYLEHGCLNGEPLLYTGIKDPEGDKLVYRVEVEDVASGRHESVYTANRELVPEWTEDPRFYWFVGWTSGDPPYPFAPRCELDPWEEPGPAGEIVKRVHVYAKEVAWSQAYHWVYTLQAS
jgi:hypothetical protein